MRAPSTTNAAVVFLLIVTCVRVAPPAAFAQAPAKLTPGGVALLVQAPPTADTREKISAALGDKDPLVRATAARVAWASGIPEIGKAVLGSLAAETDPLAAAEEIRSLLLLNGAATISSIEPHLSRAGVSGQLILAEWLGRMAPERFAEQLPGIAAAEQDAGELPAIVGVAVKQHPEHRDRILRAWVRSAGPAAWREFLESEVLDSNSDAAILIEAVHSTNDELRRATVWHVISLLGDSRDLPAGLVEAATTNPVASTDKWELFGRELIVRTTQHAKPDDRAELLKSDGAHHMDLLKIVVASPRATKREREAALSLLGDQAPQSRTRVPTTPAPATDSVPMREAWAPWRGFTREVIQAERVPSMPNSGYATRPSPRRKPRACDHTA